MDELAVALVIVSVIMVAAVAFNFFLLKMLKNTLNGLEIAHELILTLDCIKNETAYDGKYYPGNVIATLKYDCKDEMMAVDFSQYKETGIIGFTVYNTDPYPEQEFAKLGLRRDEVEQPQLIPNVIVYSPKEGFWKWKYPES